MNSFIQFLLVISFICYDGIDPSPQKKLTEKQKGIIESLVSFADSLNGKTKSSSIILTKIATLKNDNVEFMPFYHLDIDKFYKDPTPENLLLSLYQPDTLAMLLVREKADTSYLLIVYNPKNEKTVLEKRKRKVRPERRKNENGKFPDTHTKKRQRLNVNKTVFKRCFFMQKNTQKVIVNSEEICIFT